MRLRKSLSIKSLLTAFGLVACLNWCGCDRTAAVQVVPVSGKVLLDGAPLKFGSVTFQPSHGQPAQGAITTNGEFKLSTFRPGDGATPGRHQVKIACYSSQDPAEEAKKNAPSDFLGASLIPIRYTNFETSGLEVAVLAGGNKPFVFELKSEPPAENSKSEGKGDEPVPADEPPADGNNQKSNSEPAVAKPAPAEKK